MLRKEPELNDDFLQRTALEGWTLSPWMESGVFRNPEQEDALNKNKRLEESKVCAENDKQAAVSGALMGRYGGRRHGKERRTAMTNLSREFLSDQAVCTHHRPWLRKRRTLCVCRHSTLQFTTITLLVVFG